MNLYKLTPILCNIPKIVVSKGQNTDQCENRRRTFLHKWAHRQILHQKLVRHLINYKYIIVLLCKS